MSGVTRKPLPPPAPSRFAECRIRVADGCGGHHEAGPLLGAFRLAIWLCCDDCPNRDEIHSPYAPKQEG